MEAFIDAVCKELGTKNTDRPLIWKLVENLVDKELSGHDLIHPPLAKRQQLLTILKTATRPLTLAEISSQVGLSEAVTYARLSNLTDKLKVCRGEGKTYQWAQPVNPALQKRIISLSQETLKTHPSFYPDELIKQNPELSGLLDGQICDVLKRAGFTIGLKKAVSLKNQPIKEASVIIAEELAKYHPEPVSEQHLLATIKSQRAFKSIQIGPITLVRAGAIKYGYRMYGLTPVDQMDVRKFLSHADFLYNFAHAHGAIVPLARLEKSLGIKLSPADMETLATTARTDNKVRFVTTPQPLLVKSKRSNTADVQFMHLGIGTQSQRRQMWDAVEAQKQSTVVKPTPVATPAATVELKTLPTCWVGAELRKKVKGLKPGDRLKLPLLPGSPQFFSPSQQLFIKVKSSPLNNTESSVLEGICHAKKTRAVSFAGNMEEQELGLNEEVDYNNEQGFCEGYFPNDDDSEAPGVLKSGWDNCHWWCECPTCGQIGVEYMGRAERIKCKCNTPRNPNAKIYNQGTPKIKAAALAAIGYVFRAVEKDQRKQLRRDIASKLKTLFPYGKAVVCEGLQAINILCDVSWRHGSSIAPNACVLIALDAKEYLKLERTKDKILLAGVPEVWMCLLDGKLKFYNLKGELPNSLVCPGFPSKV